MKTWITVNGCKIQRILLGRSNVYLISQNNRKVMVDTGIRADWHRLQKKLVLTGKPDMVIVTHTHFDHTGNAGNINRNYSPVFLVQEQERKYFGEGYSPIPHGTSPLTRFIYNLGEKKFPYWFRVEGVPGALTFGERYDLKDAGINGYCLHTPGHSAGSISIVLDNEYAITGDTLTGIISGSAFPLWGDDTAELIRSWKKLLATGCLTFLPAHGCAVKRGKLEMEFKKLEIQTLKDNNSPSLNSKH
jgi:glyoxylase-like metal-dependent hydrolase (beta-lactamase superfamily II)